ncbi:MAG: hypothetical protein CMA53_00380 [Euryarchaeota archaeon]|jgi:hypothetical protein|nr:hypothetical protein [Euryarchaeota archaeon]|tara:strand:+ start:5405 stop:5716 length:312 start_codon:yes stop_codon:yes gene_type:complete
MGKMSDLHLTYTENGYLIHEALGKWLISIEPFRAKLNHEILTDVLENDTDLHAAKYEVFSVYFLIFLEKYIGEDLEAQALLSIHPEAHEECFEQFEEFLRNVQ